MGFQHFSHHDPSIKNYSSHVLQIRGIDLCLGCLGSKFFLIAILPILVYFLVFPNYIVSSTIDVILFYSIWLITASILLMELVYGEQINNKIAKYFVSIYFFGSIIYVAIAPTNVPFALNLSLLFAIPQISIYLNKIKSKTEFTHIKMKFLARVLFIIAFFFAIVNWQQNPLANSVYIVIGALTFLRLRSFSKFRVNEDAYLVNRLMFQNESWISRKVDTTDLFDSDGKLKNYFTESWFVRNKIRLMIAILFFFGIISLNTDLICSSATHGSYLLAPPLLAMSSGRFCSNCGSPQTGNDKFCQSCGQELESSRQQAPPQQQSGYQPTNAPRRESYTSSTGSTGGYQPYGGGRRYGGRHNTSAPIVFGVIIGLVVLLLTANIILAIVLGFVGYLGARWAESVDNPFVACCILDTCIDCICSATSAEMQRKGKF